MNRRGFIGACAALLVLPAAAIASRSVPRFIVDARNGCRLHFSPFGELDWIEMPSAIVAVSSLDRDRLLVKCANGDYILTHSGDPEREWFVHAVGAYPWTV